MANEQKENMIFSQLISRGISDDRVIGAFSSINRADFLPVQFKRSAYSDTEMHVKDGLPLLRPFVLAKIILELLNVSHETLLVVGDPTGYTTALFSQILSRCELGVFNNSEIEPMRNKLEPIKVSFIEDIKNSFDIIFLDAGFYKKSTREKLQNLLSPNGYIIYLAKKSSFDVSSKLFDFFEVSLMAESSSDKKVLFNFPLILSCDNIA